jgi:hypothetical protein
MTNLLKGLRILSISIAAAAIGSCNHSPTEPVVADSVTIVSIQPLPGTTLQAGAPVTFTATIGYDLETAPSGFVVIVIQDQASNNLSSTVPQPTVNVARGTGTVVLTDQVVIPTRLVTKVWVSFPLVHTGATATPVFQQVSYPVTPSTNP